MAERPYNWLQTGYEKRSERHIVGGALGSGDAPLVVNLRGGDVFVAEQILNLADVFAGVKQQGSNRRPQ